MTVDAVITEMSPWLHLSENWDGEGARTPLAESIQAAMSFVKLLSPLAVSPEPMLHASGRAGLYWEEDGYYTEFEFFPDRRIVYFATGPTSKHKGFDVFDGQTIPACVMPLIPRVA